ncbi:MAG: GNAT family N-acetyltransferase [Clostridium sp.]|uniref:GNAT family N-acetyltransferase n=1 Tax=Clostridium sp. TaxID=1506 RepID=UPI003D6C7E71
MSENFIERWEKILLNLRSAKAEEYEILTNIAIRSELYWGYDCDYIEEFKSVYKVTEEFINNNSTFVIEKAENIIGFYGVLVENNETYLEYLFVEPEYINKGYGKLLWNHMVENCDKNGIKGFSIVTSPQAKEFYIKMGAMQVGEVESLVKKGRKIPLLTYTLEK